MAKVRICRTCGIAMTADEIADFVDQCAVCSREADQ